MLPWINAGDAFPHASEALDDPNGLLCAGLDLSAALVLKAYARGIYPWYSEDQPVLWWSPDPRMVLYPPNFTLHRSLRKTLKHADYEIRVDTSFEAVMRACADPRPDQDGTWISEAVIEAYCDLHRAGFAHSVETWIDSELAGGLYGIALGRAFFGESMFSLVSNASKFAFISYVTQLVKEGVQLIDCQVYTEHLESLGAEMIPRNTFIKLLEKHNASI